MRHLSGLSVAALAAIALATMIIVAYAQPHLPGRWCTDNSEWLVCYREWLGALSGWAAAVGAMLVLVAARWEIESNREIASAADVQRVRAARMRLAYQLELLASAYEDVLKEIAMPGLPRKIPPMFLPQPAFDFGDLTTIPP